LRYSVRLLSLSPLQLVAADVTGDGRASGFDVSYILRFRVGMIDGFPEGKEWLFLPEKMDYDSLSSDQLGQDYTALVYGDVSGNWPGGGTPKTAVVQPLLRVGLPREGRLPQGSVVSIPLVLERADGVLSADVDVVYDSRTLRLREVQTTAFTLHFLMTYLDRDGILRIAMASDEELSGTGELLHLLFQVMAPDDGPLQSSLQISATVNEGIIAADRVIDQILSSPGDVPTASDLKQNYPNPFNPDTHIRYSIAAGEQVRLCIYNMLGQVVATLVDGIQLPGSYEIAWDGKDGKGGEVPSGIYYYRLTAGSFSSCRKMLLVR
jgi:hypothetical protein